MKLYTRRIGRGKPLIILHGLFGSSDNWLNIAHPLAENFEVFLVDQRNHGRSDHLPQMNYSLMSEDLYEFLTDFNLREIILLGHSMGGKVAMNFAFEYPHRVAKLVIVDIAPVTYTIPHREIINALMEIPLNKIQSREEADQMLALHYPDKITRQFLLKNLYRDKHGRFNWRMNLRSIDENLDALGEDVTAGRTFERPTLFIKGGASDYIMPEDFTIIKNIYKNVRIETVENATHWIHSEKPDAVLYLLMNFFEL